MKKHNSINYVLLLLIAVLISLQAWIAYDWKNSTKQIHRELESITSQDDVTMTKMKEEAYKLKMENEKNALFWYSLFANFGTVIGFIVAISGGWLAINQYFVNKSKDRLDKTYETLNTLLGEINSNPGPVSQVSALILYMEEEYSEFHKRIALALSYVGTKENKSRALEQAFVNAFETALTKMPNAMRDVSWQGLQILEVPVDIANGNPVADMSGYDFRDAMLIGQKDDAHSFGNINLKGADFSNATLGYVDFSGSDLQGASFQRADLSMVSFKNANLSEVNFIGTVAKFIDIEKANFRDVKIAKHAINWNLIKNKAYAENLGDDLKQYFADNHFVKSTGKRVLMLVNEYPPVTFGGLWTAVYHLVKSVNKAGADVALMVPASSDDLNVEIFGADINVIPINEKIVTSYDGRVIRRPSGNTASFNPYNYSTYSVVPKLDFEKYTMAAYEKVIAEDIKFDIIHAHDWVTFLTASFLSREFNRKWIAHIHSLEIDRNKRPNRVISKVEEDACKNASLIIVPSSYTQARVSAVYNIDKKKILVYPNLLSSRKKKVIEYGSFDSKRVVFSGRIAWQKGVDIFVDICTKLHTQADAVYNIYGKSEGDDYARSVLNNLPGFVEYRSSKEWMIRETIFENASVLIVPSRSEPFGMIIMEAMEYGVPVIYPSSAGIGEFINGELRLDDGTFKEACVAKVMQLLKDEDYWNKIVGAQYELLDNFLGRYKGQEMMKVWDSLG